MSDVSKFCIGISPIIIIMVATIAAGGYEVFKNIKRSKR